MAPTKHVPPKSKKASTTRSHNKATKRATKPKATPKELAISPQTPNNNKNYKESEDHMELAMEFKLNKEILTGMTKITRGGY
jgi:hypothetical protein